MRKPTKTYLSTQSSPEDLFFHDLLNHVHHLNLLLELRVLKQLNVNDREDLLNELRQITNLITLQKSKINCAEQTIKLSQLVFYLEGLVKDYVQQNGVIVSWDKQLDRADLLNGSVVQESSKRVLANLVKNIFEAKANQCRIELSLGPEYLTIRVSNNFSKVKNSLKTGHGLESIKLFMSKIDGQYWSDIVGNKWVSVLSFPYHLQKETLSKCC